MDDEDMIRELAAEAVLELGHVPETARNGEEVLKKYQEAMECGTPFDVVIMDLTVPGGMGGKEAIPRLVEMDPGVQAIVSSGYARDPVMAHYREWGFSGVLVKPYRIDQLGKVIASVLVKKDVRQAA